MDEAYDTVAVSTQDSREAILAANNSAAWRLNLAKWRGQLKYLVCLRKEGPKRRAFLVCKISAIRLRQSAEDRRPRYAIEFNEYADLPSSVRPVHGSQYPVRFGSLSTFGVDGKVLVFRPAPPKTLPYSYSRDDDRTESGITIAEAKRLLAIGLGVPEAQIEIMVRG